MWPWYLAAAGLALLAFTKRTPPVPDLIRRALVTIRTMESGGNYTATNPSSSASGAYQFLDTTWNGYGGYRRAKDAPPSVQDAKAAEHVVQIMKRFGTDPKWIPASWYVGMNGAATIDWNTVAAPEAGNKSTVAQYVQKWLATYSRVA